MGMVIAYPDRTGLAPKAPPAAGEGCRIVIFPGVRIEHHAEPVIEPPKRRDGGPRPGRRRRSAPAG
jgi:hypothetical protein